MLRVLPTLGLLLGATLSAYAQQTISVDVATRKIGAPTGMPGTTGHAGGTIITITNVPAGSAPRMAWTCRDNRTTPALVPPDQFAVANGVATDTLPADGTIQGILLTLPCEGVVLLGNDRIGVVKLGETAPATRETAEEYARYVLRSRFGRPYDIRENTVYMVIGPNGRMLTPVPANVDQDDRFIITVVALSTTIHRYDIRVDEGEYAPSDFVIRPTTEIDLAAAQGTGQTAVQWDTASFVLGPYTTPKFVFTVTYDDSAKGRVVDLRSHSIRINPLYHASLGVGVVRTQLALESFRAIDLTGGNTTRTIVAVNGGDRAIPLASAILHWSIFSADWWEGGAITRGYDPLKEAAVWERIFPMIGVGLERKLTNNLFAGGAFEIARGATLIAGVHYGKARKLADPNFVLGETLFNGDADDIETSDDYQSALFYGGMIDTRLLSALFGIGRTSNR